VAVTLLILNWSPLSISLGQSILLVATVLSLVSGIRYFRQFWRCIDLDK